MGSVTPELQKGREAFERHAWESAHDAFTRAREAGPLEPEDLSRLALASYLTGRGGDALQALQDEHQAHLDRRDPVAAARSAFWLGFLLATRGETARATGWFARGDRLLDDVDRECAERGYLMIPVGHRQLVTGDFAGAASTAAEAAAVGRRFGDRDLVALAVHLQGRARLRERHVDEGLSLLDEAMVAVATGELSPLVTGLVYCSVIGACREVHALRRAHEWTAALTAWCDRQPDMVAYSGECRVYRSEILQLHGEWHEAIDEARRAADRLAGMSEPGAVGLARYQEGEVHRLRGEFATAEEAYRAASRSGREPQPGLALLRLAQGDAGAAAAAMRRALAETRDPLRRTRLLPAAIEIMLDTGDLDGARGAHAELEELAKACAPGELSTVVRQARGAIHLAAGEAMEALAPLRQAWREWQTIGAPYQAARVRVLLGLACRQVGDEDSAALELEAAREAFKELGAGPDVARVDALTGRDHPRSAARDVHGLTPREREVLALVATGRTNRAIAGELFISEKTVARHVANIFGKLGLSSRAAATAYAYEHDLLGPPA